MIGRIAGENMFHSLPEDLLEVEIEGPGGAVVIDVRIEVQPCIEEAAEG